MLPIITLSLLFFYFFTFLSKIIILFNFTKCFPSIRTWKKILFPLGYNDSDQNRLRNLTLWMALRHYQPLFSPGSNLGSSGGKSYQKGNEHSKGFGKGSICRAAAAITAENRRKALTLGGGFLTLIMDKEARHNLKKIAAAVVAW